MRKNNCRGEMGLGIGDSTGTLCILGDPCRSVHLGACTDSAPCSVLWKAVGTVDPDFLPALQPYGAGIEHGCEPQGAVPPLQG